MVAFPQHPPEPQPPPPEPPRRYGKNSSTVHLCAAAYMDQGFRDRVLREVYHRTDRALAPNPGADPVPVFQHALRAQALTVARGAVVAGFGLIVLMASPASFMAAAMVLVVWQMLAAALRLLIEITGDLRVGRTPDWNIVFARSVLIAAVLALASAALTGSVVLLEAYGDQTRAPTDDAGAGIATLWLLLLALITVGFELVGVYSLKNLPTGADPPIDADPRLKFIAAHRDPVVVNYAAERSPFVGSGAEITTWQFALPLRRKRRGRTEHESPWPHFDTSALSDHVKDAMAALASDTERTRRLPGLELSDHLFVSGHDTVMPTATIEQLAASGYRVRSLDDVRDDPTTPLRHYLRCQIVSWDGELVTTVFVHTALQGETLYMEFSSYVLPPTRSEYHVYGRDALSTPAAMAAGGVRSILRLPSLTGRALVELFAVTREGLRRGGTDRSPRWSVRGSDDFGAAFGIRELGSDEVEHNYFQLRDAVKYTKILERQLLATVVDYLGDKIDTAELTARAETIINAGVVNYGSIQAGAVGTGASARVGAVGDRSEGTVEVPEGSR